MSKLAKAEVNYSKGHATSHCGQWRPSDRHYCEHFQEPQSCTKVAGEIDRYYWCKKFEKVK